MASRGALYFDAGLYGSPNLAAEGGYEGIRRFQKRFASDGSDNMMLPEYRAQLSRIGAGFSKRVGQRFAEKHGRTGRTQKSMTQSFTPAFGGNPNVFKYSVKMGGGVGFVINPIGAHDIPVSQHGGLSNFKSAGATAGRTQNFYSDFPAFDTFFKTIPWYQGGGVLGESYSPDRSWYEEDEDIVADAQYALSLLAARAVLIWGTTDGAGSMIPLSQPTSNFYDMGFQD